MCHNVGYHLILWHVALLRRCLCLLVFIACSVEQGAEHALPERSGLVVEHVGSKCGLEFYLCQVSHGQCPGEQIKVQSLQIDSWVVISKLRQHAFVCAGASA